MMRVLTIFGTRPEAVKVAPLLRELEQAAGIQSLVCVTGQHREMLNPLLDWFGIRADATLDVMNPGQPLAHLTSALLLGLEKVISDLKPDWVLVQGDTTTCMAGALSGFYQKVKVGHVEAGLRTRNRWEPFPEEINRRIAGVTVELHFAPTQAARQNLLAEGVAVDKIIVTGNTGIDALRMVLGMEMPDEAEKLLSAAGVGDGRRLVLVTAHRRENHGAGLEQICGALRSLAGEYAGKIAFIYPLHRNPRVWGPVREMLEGCEGITLTDPLEYPVMAHLLNRAHIVLTDSGGIQEEATALGKPTLVLRNETERPEGVAAGVLRVVGTDREKILHEARTLLDNAVAYAAMARPADAYGDGHAAARIVQALRERG